MAQVAGDDAPDVARKQPLKEDNDNVLCVIQQKGRK